MAVDTVEGKSQEGRTRLVAAVAPLEPLHHRQVHRNLGAAVMKKKNVHYIIDSPRDKIIASYTVLSRLSRGHKFDSLPRLTFEETV